MGASQIHLNPAHVLVLGASLIKEISRRFLEPLLKGLIDNLKP